MFGKQKNYEVKAEQSGMRIDQALASLESQVSRQYFQKLLKAGFVLIDHVTVKPSFKVLEGMKIIVKYPKPLKMDIEPVEMPLKIVFEDQYLMVIDKAPGVVVHPAAHGLFMKNSLVNGVMAHVGDGLKGIGGVLRPGIVHRLDKDTSGLIVIAKKDVVHQHLVEQFKAREVKKYYFALVKGSMSLEHGFIEDAIGRNVRNRKLMAVDGIKAKEAKTEFWKLQEYSYARERFSLLNIALHTGRTHQIRVHFSSVKHALVGDQQYGDAATNKMFKLKFGLDRQFLHAYKIIFIHPITKKAINLEIDLPLDLRDVLERLKKED